MIKLTRLNNEFFFLNCDIIEYIEEVPHTVIKTVNNNTYIVVESAETIINEIIAFKKKTNLIPPIIRKEDK